jgi:predicted esterase
MHRSFNQNGYDCVFLQAPNVLPRRNGPHRDNARAWFYWNANDPSDTTLRLATRTTYHGLDQSLKVLDQCIQHHNDENIILLGFSQGSVLAHIVALQMASSLQAVIFISGHTVQESSFVSRGDIFATLCPVPSLHWIGRQDTRVPPTMSLELAHAFQNHQIAWHDKGHVIPQRKADCVTTILFLQSLTLHS